MVLPQSPPEILQWARYRFRRQEIVATTGFGMEGCALIDMLARADVPARVLYIDTGFLFAETLDLRDRLVARYRGVRFDPIKPVISIQTQAALHGDQLWRTDPDQCCKLRKVEPLRDALADVDVLITGLRRGQGQSRSTIPVVSWDTQHGVVKLNPLAAWSRANVWEYIQAQDVPFNPLHLANYPSVGCTHCTQPVPGTGPAEYSRVGRWAGREKTECGLHLAPSAERTVELPILEAATHE
jgi:phosphoadenosine phosphosulfate reductase